MQSIQLAMEENSLIEFNTKDKEEILHMAFDYIDHFMNEFLLTMQKPSFHVDLFDSVLEYLIQNFDNKDLLIFVYCNLFRFYKLQ